MFLVVKEIFPPWEPGQLFFAVWDKHVVQISKNFQVLKWKIFIIESVSMTNLGVADGRVVRAGVSVTWNVMSWSGVHEFEPRLGRTWGA